MANSIIRDKSFQFALHIFALVRQLRDSNEYILANQLLKSGTSIGANVEEALAAQSRKDFIAKMSIASKEAREARYRILLLKESDLVEIEIIDQLNEIQEIIKILTSIVKTSQGKQSTQNSNHKS